MPTWTPWAPWATASRTASGVPTEPASQNGRPTAATLRDVRLVAGAEHRLPPLVAHRPTPRRRVVATGGRALDDEAVRPDGGVAREVGRQHLAGHDGQEHRPLQRRQLRAEQLRRVDLHGVVPARVTGDVDGQAGRAVQRELVEQVGQVARDAGADEHGVHPREHRAVDGVGHRHLDLLQVVDADQPVVPLLGQPHLDEVGQHRQLLDAAALAQAQPRHRRVRHAGRPSAGPQVTSQDALDDRRHGERGHRATDRPVEVTVLEPPGQHQVQRGPRHDAELPAPGHRGRQAPRRHRDTHPALDDRGQRVPQRRHGRGCRHRAAPDQRRRKLRNRRSGGTGHPGPTALAGLTGPSSAPHRRRARSRRSSRGTSRRAARRPRGPSGRRR